MGDSSAADRRRSAATLRTSSPIEFEGGDPAIWTAFTQTFTQVQSMLDRNRLLIEQVNENHQSKMHENMAKNVALIQEINGNISKIVSMYSKFAANFSGVCQQRRDCGGDNRS